MNKYVMAILAGVTIGILIAPKKGSAIRKNLLDALNDLNRIASEEDDNTETVEVYAIAPSSEFEPQASSLK